MGAIEHRLAEFIAETPAKDVPAAAIEAAARSSLDAAGCILAASAEPMTANIVRFALEESPADDCTIVGARRRTSRGSAALANGTLAHWLDFDDGRTAAGHAASVLLPAVLSIGEPLGASGRELATAYAIGLEAATHVSDSCQYEESIAGFHRTALFGSLAATAAAARLHGLDTGKTMMAIGIVCSMPSGLVQNFGTHAKPLHSGLAARSAVTAVRLAAEGWTGSPDIIAGPVGWAASYIRHYDSASMGEKLGAVWRTAEAPPMIKAYPCCGGSHGPLESFLNLMGEHKFALEDVAEVEVGTTYDSLVMLYEDVASAFQGKFSVKYSVASALADGAIGIDSFHDDMMRRPRMQEALGKVKVKLTSKWAMGMGTGGNDHKRVKPFDTLPVVVTLKNGQTVSRSTKRVSGLQTEEEVLGKFRDNARRALRPEAVDGAVAQWSGLLGAADIRVPLSTVSGETVLPGIG
jgi:2-methylcitrate dehydratase PrpD